MEQHEYSHEASKITFNKISSWEELNATTLEEADEKFKEATKKYWKEFAVSGVLQFDPKGGKQILRPFTDLDGRAALGVLRQAGIDTSNLTYVKPGEYLHGAINLDTGDRFGVLYEEPTYTAYFDHHEPGTKEVTSTAEIVYKTMVDLGMLEKSEAMDRLIKFVTDMDNRHLPSEEFLRSSKTILGLQRDLTFVQLLSYFKERESPTEELAPEELEKYGLKEAAEKQQKVVDEAVATLERMEKEGKITDTEYGKLVINVNNELKVGSSAAYVKYDGIINFTPDKSFAVTLKEKNLRPEKIKLILGEKFRGKFVRDKMWIYNEKEPPKLKLEDVAEGLAPQLFHISDMPGIKILEPRIPKFRLPEEPEEANISVADEWWKCAMLYPAQKHTSGLKNLYLYRVHPEDREKFKSMEGNPWIWSSKEKRSQEKVRVIFIGEVDLDNPEISKSFSRPCGNCGGPWMWCDDGSYCDAYPTLENPTIKK